MLQINIHHGKTAKLDSVNSVVQLFSVGAEGFMEDFGDVEDSDGFLLAADEAVEVHQAGHVGGGEDFGAGLLVIGDAVEAHLAGDGFFGDGEQAAEAAAFVGALELGQFDVLKRGQELSRLVECGPTSSVSDARRSSRRP